MAKESIKYTQLPPFDELLTMANEQPEQLEVLRQKMINEIIDQAKPQFQKRLRGLQFQIDAQRKIAKTPLAACIKLSSMMMDSFEKLRNELPAAKQLGRIGLSIQARDSHLRQETIQSECTPQASNSNVVQFRPQQ